ncbi:1080_t:CDS:1, partial [Funneliformis geosporum]
DMVPLSLSQIIRKKCEKFVISFIESDINILSQKLSHNREWKESDEEFAEVTSAILGSLNDSWNNPAFSSEFTKSQNKGTYVTNVIVPAIQATLKDLPLGRSSYVST